MSSSAANKFSNGCMSLEEDLRWDCGSGWHLDCCFVKPWIEDLAKLSYKIQNAELRNVWDNKWVLFNAAMFVVIFYTAIKISTCPIGYIFWWQGVGIICVENSFNKNGMKIYWQHSMISQLKAFRLVDFPSMHLTFILNR